MVNVKIDYGDYGDRLIWWFLNRTVVILEIWVKIEMSINYNRNTRIT